VEAWLEGWHIHFPPDGGEPTVDRGSPPASLSGSDADVTVAPFDSGTAVRYGSWIVKITESDFAVIPAKPQGGGGDGGVAFDHRVYRR
jgi:hypothetical protein